MMTAKEWRKKYPDPRQRREFARISPLAWILEYEPEIIRPGIGRVPFEPYWFQQELLQSDHKFRIVEKSRQVGISTTEAFEAAWELLEIPAARLVVISKGYEEVKEFMQYVTVALESIEQGGKYPNFPKWGKKNEDEITFPELDSRIKALPASETAGRSFASTHFRFDESAHTKFAQKIFKAASPGISTTGGRITMFSSPAHGSYYSQLVEKHKDLGAELWSFPWWYSPAFNPVFDEWYAAYLAGNVKQQTILINKAKQGAWYKSERPKYSKSEWESEFECSSSSGGGQVFSKHQIKETFRKPWLVEQEVDEGELWVDPNLNLEHYFASGVDLGRKVDAYVVVSFDYSVSPAKVVLYRRVPGASGVSWKYILDDAHKMYRLLDPRDENRNYMRHDATAMGGDVISEALEDISEPLIFSNSQTSKQKYNLIEQTRKAMDDGQIILPRIDSFLSEFRNYRWLDKGLKTDVVMATITAVSVFDPGGGKVEVIVPAE